MIAHNITIYSGATRSIRYSNTGWPGKYVIERKKKLKGWGSIERLNVPTLCEGSRVDPGMSDVFTEKLIRELLAMKPKRRK